jgi:WD40 repeat protein
MLRAVEARQQMQALLARLGGVDRPRFLALLEALAEEGSLSLAQALTLTFPEKPEKAALPLFRQLRERLRNLEAGLELVVDNNVKSAASARLVWFAASVQADALIAQHTELHTQEFGGWVPTSGFPRDELDKLEVRICIWGGREDSALGTKTKALIQALQTDMQASKQFRVVLQHIEDIDPGDNVEQATTARFADAHLVLAFLSPARLGKREDLGKLFPGGMSHVFPVVAAEIDPALHEFGVFESVQAWRFSRERALMELSVKEARDASQYLHKKLVKFIASHIVPLAERWKWEQVMVQRFLQELKESAPVHIPTEGRAVSLSAAKSTALVLSAPLVESQAADELDGSGTGRRVTLEYLDEWLERGERQPYMALLGEYGMGKTTTLKAWCRDRLALWRNNPKTVPVPIYINLARLSSVLLDERVRLTGADESREMASSKRLYQLTAEELLDAVLESMYNEQPAASERLFARDIIRRLRDESALLVLDSLDEVLVHLGEQGGLDLVRKLLSLLPPTAWLAEVRVDERVDVPAKTSAQTMRPQQLVRQRRDGGRPGCLVIACRTHYFSSLQALSNAFLDEQRSGAKGQHFDAFLLLPFVEQQIRDYLAAVVPERDTDELMALLWGIHNLSDLVTRPYHLQLVSEFFGDLEQARAAGQVVNAASLYGQMVKASLGRDSVRHWLRPAHKEELLAEAAWQMHQRGDDGWQVDELEAWFLALLEQRPAWQRALGGRDEQLVEQLCEDLRSATFLVHEGTAGGQAERFRFAHRSMYEYFLAKALVGALRLPAAQGVAYWAVPLLSDETYAFVEQLLTTAAEQKAYQAGFEAIKASGNAEAASQLLALVFARLARERVAVSEGKTLPTWPLPNLARGNYSGVNLVALDQRYAIAGPADRLNLAGSQLRDVKAAGLTLRNLNLLGADLSQGDFRHTTWVNCLLNDVKWLDEGLPPSLKQVPMLLPKTEKYQKRYGHTSLVYSVAFSHDGRRVVSGSRDDTLRIWDASTGKSLLVLKGHTSWVYSVAFSHDGRRVVSGSRDGTLRVWDASTGESLLVLTGHTDLIRSVAFSHDSSRIVSGSHDKTLRIWDASTGESLLVLKGHTSYVSSVAFSHDSCRIVSGSDDKTLHVWDANSGESLLMLRGNTSYVSSVAFSHDSSRIVSGSGDNTLRVWDASTGESLLVLTGHTRSVESVAFSHDSRRIVSGSLDGERRVWDASTGESLLVLTGHTSSVTSVAFSDDSSRIVSGSRDKTVQVWDASTGESLLVLTGHTSSVTSVAFSHDSRRIVSGSDNKTLRVWDASTRESLLVLTGHTDSVSSVAFSHDSRRIVSGSGDNTLRVWDASTGKSLLVLTGHTDLIRSVAFSHDGSRIVSGSHDDTLRVWDASTGESLLVLKGHTSSVFSVAFSHDSSRIVYGSGDNTVRVCDANTGESLLVLKGHTSSVFSVAFSNDSSRIVSGSYDKTLHVWDASTGESLLVLTGHTSSVTSVAFSHDSSRIVSGSHNKTLRIWDANTGKSLLVLTGHTSSVTSVAFSHDGSRIVSASSDGTWMLWELDPSATPISAHRDVHERLYTEGISSLIAGMAVRGDAQRGVPDTAVVLDMLSGQVLQQKGDAWLLVQPKDGQ